MKKLSLPLLLILVLSMAACTAPGERLDPVEESYSIAAKKAPLSNSNNAFTTFKVRLENVAPGASGFVTPFAPGIWIVQKKNSAPLFVAGQADFGQGLENLAEDGSPATLDANLQNHPKVRSKGIFAVPVGASGPAPIFPGDAYEFYVTAKPNDYLNFATMFIQSNDLFVGPLAEGIALFDQNRNPISGDVTAQNFLWDAGTEVNETPGVGPNQAPRQSGPNTGPDENGVVQIVNDGYTYPAVSEVIKITVTAL